MLIVFGVLFGLAALIGIGGYFTMILAALAAEYFDILAPIGFWEAVILYMVLAVFLAVVSPTSYRSDS